MNENLTARGLADVELVVQEAWSDVFMQELREQLLLAGLVSHDYEGEIKQGGDKVKVSQINAPDGQLKTVGTDSDTFSTSKMSVSQVEVAADKRAVEAYEIEDLVYLQSQLGRKDSEVRQSLLFSVMKQMNDYAYSKVAPLDTDLDRTHVATSMTAAELRSIRTLASRSKWNKMKDWYMLLDPQYYGELLGESNIISSDFVNDRPVIGGQIAERRFGFNILEDNSRGEDGSKYGLAFHPDWLLLVMQQQPRFKLSDAHAQGKFSFVLSVDLVFGAELGIDGNKKHITILES